MIPLPNIKFINGFENVVTFRWVKQSGRWFKAVRNVKQMRAQRDGLLALVEMGGELFPLKNMKNIDEGYFVFIHKSSEVLLTFEVFNFKLVCLASAAVNVSAERWEVAGIYVHIKEPKIADMLCRIIELKASEKKKPIAWRSKNAIKMND